MFSLKCIVWLEKENEKLILQCWKLPNLQVLKLEFIFGESIFKVTNKQKRQ